MTNKAKKKRRQRKRKQQRQGGDDVQAEFSTPAPATVTHWVSDCLPEAWAASVHRALAHLSAETGRVYGRSRDAEQRCEHVAHPTDHIALCLTARGNLARAEYVAEARFVVPNAGMVAIGDDQPPNPGVIAHEMKHVITGDTDHEGADWNAIREYAA